MMRGPGDEGPGAGNGGCRLVGAPSQGTASLWPWMGFRDTRIVRVCRSSGEKDRHSKVTTIRGLRDRRVRLSVETALQLYDLQDKLGLDRPSKVVDWLLNAAQHEIDKLPPLPFIPASYMRCPPASFPPLYGAGPHKGISVPAATDMIGGVAPGPPLAPLPIDHPWDDGFLIRRAEMLLQDEEEPRNAVGVHLPNPHCSCTDASYSGNVVPQTQVKDQLQAPPYGYRPLQLLLCPTAEAPTTFSLCAELLPPSNYDPAHVNGFYMGYSGSSQVLPDST